LKRPLALAVIVVATAGILVATLHAGGHSTSQTWNWTLTSGDAALAELLQNLILFIPLGIGLRLAGVPLLRAVFIGGLLSFSVEFMQQWVPGRDPSVGDIVCNTTSTAFGAGAPAWSSSHRAG
jgi:glycopeptide antibiotics resistance protein